MQELEDIIRENQEEYEELLVSIEAGVGTLNLLMAVCDDNAYRNQLITQYEQELAPDIRPYRITLDQEEPSLKGALNNLTIGEEYLRQGGKAVVTVTSAEKLYFMRLGKRRSQQEIFAGYLQWTREGLRNFPYSIVLWVTSQIEELLVYKAPDFWSWRKGVFRFISKKTAAVSKEEFLPLKPEFEEQLPDNNNDQPSLLPLQDLQELIQRREETKGLKDPGLTSLYESMGRIYKSRAKEGKAENYQQERERAILYFQKAVDLRKELGRNNGLESTLSNLASLYEARGNYSEAEALYAESLELRKQFFGETNMEIAMALIDLAGVYHNQALYEKAISFYNQALAMQKQCLGEESPAIATTFNHLAGTYHAQGDQDKAQELYQQALDLRKKVLGEEHPDVANSLSNLGLLYYEQGNYGQAEPLLLQSLQLKKKLFLGDDHPDIATLYNNLGLLAYAQEQYEGAESYLKKALELRRHIFGQEHPDIAISLHNLGGFYKARGKTTLAKEYYEEALVISEQKFGKDHPITVKIKDNLDKLTADEHR